MPKDRSLCGELMRKATRTWRISSQRKSQDLSQDLELAEVFQV